MTNSRARDDFLISISHQDLEGINYMCYKLKINGMFYDFYNKNKRKKEGRKSIGSDYSDRIDSSFALVFDSLHEERKHI